MCNSDKIIVGSAYIHNGFAGQHYLPYSIGILQAHVLHNSKKKERYDFRSTIYKRELLKYKRELLNDCVKKLKDLGYSCSDLESQKLEKIHKIK